MSRSVWRIRGFVCVLSITSLLGCGDGDGTSSSGDTGSSNSKAVSTSTDTTPPEPIAESTETSKPGGWGTLKGRIVFDGDAPTRAQVVVTTDKAYCGKVPPLDDSLVVSSENGGVANVGIWLRSKEAPPIAESLADASSAVVTLDNVNCRFEPHVAVVLVGQTVKLRNSDTVAHNAKIDSRSNPPLNPVLSAKAELDTTFDSPERLATAVSCSIHPWMTSFILVRDNPYAIVTGPDGSFEIKDLPSGTWTFQFWHETVDLSEVKLDGKPTKWSKSRVELNIVDGEVLDLGDIKVK